MPAGARTCMSRNGILWLVAAVLVVVGIVQLFQGQVLLGIILIVLGAGVGPGGWTFLNRRNT